MELISSVLKLPDIADIVSNMPEWLSDIPRGCSRSYTCWIEKTYKIDSVCVEDYTILHLLTLKVSLFGSKQVLI